MPGSDAETFPGDGSEGPDGMAGGDGMPAPPEDGAVPEGDVYYQATIDANGNVIPDGAPTGGTPVDGGNVGDGDDALIYQIYAN